jgi:hypothetical protein
MPEPVAVLHSTESYAFHATLAFLLDHPGIQPHELYDPETDLAHTFIHWPTPARALKNLPGGVETNNRPGGVWQLEIIGYAAQADNHSEQWYANLGAHLRRRAKDIGFRLTVPYPFVVSPIPKGTDPRITPSQWYDLEGIIGHQRIPEQNHSDPGLLTRLIPHLNEPLKETTIMLTQLGYAMATLDELYLAHRGQLPTTDERHIWRTDMLDKARQGVDLEPTLAYIDWALRQEA